MEDVPSTWTPQAVPVSEGDFSAPMLVIHFWAAWDRWDREMDIVLQRLQSEFAPRIRFRSANTDDANVWPLCKKVKILNIPAIACFRNGNHVQTIVGLRSEHEFRSIIATWEAGGKK